MSSVHSRCFFWTVALGALLLLLASCGNRTQPVEEQGALYYCPMHPTYTSDQPGDCPICNMRLVRSEPDAAAADPRAHPEGPSDMAAGAEATAVEGRIGVTITPERQQLIGVSSEPVRRQALAQTLRTAGRVAYDESRLHHVHTKVEGYLEHLYVDYTGAPVQRGDKLVEIYSPELLATQQEYLLAHRAAAQLAESALAGVARQGQELLEAARQRLLLWDISSAEIDQLEHTGNARKTLTLYSPYSGYVIEKTALHGMRVMPGESLYDIADLSRVWVLADIYEYELPYVRLGQPATMTLSFLPGRSWSGRVAYIYPVVEADTRTVKVRLEFGNPELLLKPDMFADVVFEGDLGIALTVPESAVILTGTGSLVFVERGAGRFEPRQVEIGARLPGAYEVRSGLAEGERVVTGANFLIDSESKLKAALSGMAGPEHGGHGREP